MTCHTLNHSFTDSLPNLCLRKQSPRRSTSHHQSNRYPPCFRRDVNFSVSHKHQLVVFSVLVISLKFVLCVSTTVDSVDLNDDLLNYSFHSNVGGPVLLLNSFDIRTTIVTFLCRDLVESLFYQTPLRH